MVKPLDNYLNENRFIPIDREELTALEYMGKVTEKTNEVVKNLDNKLDIDGDFNGSWKGFDNPIMSDPGIAMVVDEIANEKIPVIEEQLTDMARTILYIDPDRFKGTDIEKMQQAINMSVSSSQETEIILHRIYNITGGTVFLNRDKGTEKQFYTNNVKIIGRNGGLVKTDKGRFFSSNDMFTYEGELETHYTGNLTLSNLSILGSNQRDVVLIDGDKLIRTYLLDNNINFVGCLIKSKTYTQSFYALRNIIRQGLGTLLDTENNYDLNFSDNLVEWNENFFKFSGANGCRVNNNLIEGLTGYTVLATNGCQSMSFDNNYFEVNKSYFDLTLLKGYGLKITGSYFSDGDTTKACISLPTKMYGSSPDQDQYVFISNVASGGIFMYEFKEAPQSEMKYISIGCMGATKNVRGAITFIGTSFSETNGNVKKYFQNGSITMTTKHQTTITGNDPLVTVIDVNMEEAILPSDNINVYIKAVTNYDYVQLINVYPVGNIVKVAIKGTGVYAGAITVDMNITVSRVAHSRYF